MENGAVNTDRVLWREREDDPLSDSIHVTQDGGIGMNVGGSVIVMPIFEWHALATGATRVGLTLKRGPGELAEEVLNAARGAGASEQKADKNG